MKTDIPRSKLLTIESVAYGGDGVGRLSSGKVCFVPGTLPGETVSVEIVQEKKSFSRGRVLSVVTPSPDRITPECALSGDCPGCAYLHANYEAELRFKESQLRDFFIRSGISGAEVLEKIFPSPQRFWTRNKIKLHCRNGRCGYIAADNVSLLPLKECLLAHSGINEEISQTSVNCDECVTFRVTEHDGVITYRDSEKVSDRNWLTENLPGAGEFKVAADGFFQTNIPVAAELVRRVTESIRRSGKKRLIELYCGVGVFSVAAAQEIAGLQSVGIELDKKAVRAAKFNASRHNVSKRCRFYAGDAGIAFEELTEREDALLLLDPPRGGLSTQTLQAVIKSRVGKIIYISCAPDTLRRDLSSLCGAGWKVTGAGALDMFPCTGHFETIAELEYCGE